VNAEQSVPHHDGGQALPALLALAVATACAGDGGSAGGQLVQITLNVTTVNAGQVGRASLVAVGDRTEVVVWVSGVPPMLASRPVHLYTFLFPGSCAKPGAEPAYALTAQVLAQSPSTGAISAGGPFTVTNVAPLPLATLARGPFALKVFTAPADGRREIFCGDVGGFLGGL
jgi:hypothetical protein